MVGVEDWYQDVSEEGYRVRTGVGTISESVRYGGHGQGISVSTGVIVVPVSSPVHKDCNSIQHQSQ